MPTADPSPLTGLHYLVRGAALIRQPGLRRFVLLPLAINVALFGGLIGLLFNAVGAVLAWAGAALAVPDWLASWAIFQGLVALLQWLLWAVVGLGAVVLVFYCFSLLANLIAAPFNSLLAEKVERHLRGELVRGEESWAQLLRSLPQVMSSELFKFLYLIVWLIPLSTLWVLTWFIPGLNLLSTLAWLWFGAWLQALEYTDYPAGNNGLNFRRVRRLAKRRRPAALGFGLGVTAMTSVPLLNLIAMPCAVAGATALWVEQLSQLPEARP